LIDIIGLKDRREDPKNEDPTSGWVLFTEPPRNRSGGDDFEIYDFEYTPSSSSSRGKSVPQEAVLKIEID